MVNRERKRKRRLNEGISMQEWDRYFRDLLGGAEGRVVMGARKEGELEEEEEDIRREEVWEMVGKLREGTAMGSEGIPNEVWKFGGEMVKVWLWEVCNRMWKGERWPEDWRERSIVPIGMKGKGKKVGDYRGVMLAQTAYKVYAAVLAERLRKEVEEKGLLPPREDGGVVRGLEGSFFDSVDRRILVEAMRKRGVREGLVMRCKELLRDAG
ncbi:uncharacterized protein [Temnothorax longispinosus]|uniref:uncharacterized protein n=1 Tax=Temnothorax longispinosus TaxID=300112 RepID=UPI003A98E545